LRGPRQWRETHPRAPSAPASGRTRARPPRRRRAGPRAGARSPTRPRDPPARRPSRALWREWLTSLNLYHYGKDHRPAVGSVVDQLAYFVVQVLLQQLDLADLLAQARLQDAVRLLAQLVEQRPGVVAEP